MRQMKPKLQEKLEEAFKAVLPVVGIVLLLCFSVAPVPPGIVMEFLVGAVFLIIGMMFFTLGAEISMTPMGEAVGRSMTRSKKLWVFTVLGFIRHHHIGAGSAGAGRSGALHPQHDADPFGGCGCGNLSGDRSGAYAFWRGSGSHAVRLLSSGSGAGVSGSGRFSGGGL